MSLSHTDKKLIDDLVNCYKERQQDVKLFVNQVLGRLTETKNLFDQVHSIKWRVKDPEHLRDKLTRKILKAHKEGTVFDVTMDNLYARINDLGGLRILHLYTRQTESIHKALREALDEAQLPIIGEPDAKTWDNETRSYFQSIGISTSDSESLYTSVHYVIESNSRTKYTCEIQVRTLAEELWGEVSHVINYPHPTQSISCKEQIAVLARVTSSCSRLVDSIFRSNEEYRASSIVIPVIKKKRSKKAPLKTPPSE